MSFPFAPRLGTNYCPTDEEVLEIQTLLVEPTLKLKRLDAEIADLQKVVDRLAEERESLAAYVATHQALISPVRRLPLDVIQEIFIACLPTHRNCVMSASEPPVLLGRICSSWRTISLSTPRIWARLHVAEPIPPYNSTPTVWQEKLAQRLETTKLWLGRSGQCPLSISLQTAPENDNLDLPATTSTSWQFLEALIPFAARWQHIHFTTLPIVLETISRLELDAPILETVSFHHQYCRSLDGLEWGPFNVLRGAQISSFCIPGSIFICDRFPLRWDQLTTLLIGGHPWAVIIGSEETLRAISRCPELRCCKLMINDAGTVDLSHHPIVELPFLHTLDVYCVRHGAPVVSFLERLLLPKLRDFSFLGYATGHHDNSPSFSLAAFFARATRMETIGIDSNTFSKFALLESLRGLPPTIQRLAIHDKEVTAWGLPPETGSLDDDALAVLTPTSGCPALQHFSIDHCTGISDAALLRFLTAKMAGESCTALTHVDIQFDRTMTLDILPSLEPFIETGRNVSITHLPSPLSQFSPWQGLDDAPKSWFSVSPTEYW